MTDEQILKKAVEKACKNGFVCVESMPPILMSKLIEDNLYYSVIFSHDFARALWGGDDLTINLIVKDVPIWQYNLMKMVKEKEPIRYLEKFLK